MCMPMTKATKPMAMVRRRARRPAVIIAIHSRHARRASWRANQIAVPDWIMARFARCSFPLPQGEREFASRDDKRLSRRLRRLGDEREEGVLQAGIAVDLVPGAGAVAAGMAA